MPNNPNASKAICATCGVIEQNQESGYCINGHDDWLEENDPYEYWVKAAHQLKVSMTLLEHAMKSGGSLIIVKPSMRSEWE